MNRITILILLITASVVFPQTNRILLDEDFSDWSQSDLFYTDTQGDYESGEYDLLNLSVSNDEHYLFLNVEFAEEIILQEDNTITIYIDTDNNASTGRTLFGVGSELEFTFGGKTGVAHFYQSNPVIDHADIGLVALPTVASNKFEIAINKGVTITGQPLFTNTTVKILLISNSTVGDRLPNEDGGVTYTFKNEALQSLPAYSIQKQSNEYLRVMSYNPERVYKDNQQIDGLFDPDRIEHHRKIFQAIQPDIIGLVEMYSHTSQETADVLSTFISSSPAGSWYNSKITYDLMLLSKFPIKQEIAIKVLDDIFESHAALLDLRPKYETDILIIIAHPKAFSGNDHRRQAHIDSIMEFIRNVKDGVGSFTITDQIPVIIMGDMNFVQTDGPRETILTGNISDNQAYGPDFNPDWDNSNFEDLKPFTTDAPMVFTSYNEESSYSPSRLDYIFYSGSVMEPANSFVLFTKDMPSDILAANGLAYNTTTLASDHLPVVADFSLPYVTGIDERGSVLPNNFYLKQNFPNPFNPETVIGYSVPKVESKESLNVRLKVYNILGKEIETLVNMEQPPGNYEVKFDIKNKPGLTSGVYFYAIMVGSEFDVKKMTLVK